MDISNHPTVAMELARYRMQEEIARADAYRTAREVRAAERAAQREARKVARDTRAVAQSRGISLLTVLRGSAGRA